MPTGLHRSYAALGHANRIAQVLHLPLLASIHLPSSMTISSRSCPMSTRGRNKISQITFCILILQAVHLPALKPRKLEKTQKMMEADKSDNYVNQDPYNSRSTRTPGILLGGTRDFPFFLTLRISSCCSLHELKPVFTEGFPARFPKHTTNRVVRVELLSNAKSGILGKARHRENITTKKTAGHVIDRWLAGQASNAQPNFHKRENISSERHRPQRNPEYIWNEPTRSCSFLSGIPIFETYRFFSFP